MAVGRIANVVLAGAVALFATAPLAFGGDSVIRIIHSSDGRIEAVEAGGLDQGRLAALNDIDDKAWQRIFAVYVGDRPPEQLSSPPAIIGAYKIHGRTVRFTPRFPLTSGMRYIARFNTTRFADDEARSGDRWVDHVFDSPEAETRGTTVVTQIYPSAGAWPGNTLKFYVHFSSTMKREQAYEHIHLVNSVSGEAIEQAFVETRPELWDPQARRLTVLFHPGRLKRGLTMSELSGPPLEQGRTYTIVIDQEMVDANGQPLAERHERTIAVDNADRSGPDPLKWRVDPPGAGTDAGLVVEFREPLDRALLDRFLIITDPANQPLAGRIEVENDEKRWRFLPDSVWQTGTYELVVSRRLEDLAGNTPRRTFETAEDAKARAEVDPYIRVPFEVR